MNNIPDVCSIVHYGVNSFGTEPATYRVSGYMKKAVTPQLRPDDWIGKILFESCRKFRDDSRLQDCVQEEAEYLCLTGICGAIAPVSECTVIRMVDWPAEHIKQEQEYARLRGIRGEVLF